MQRPRSSPRKKLTSEEREFVRSALKDMLKGNVPFDMQVEFTIPQEEGRDALGQALTGSGKTVVAAGSYAIEKIGSTRG